MNIVIDIPEKLACEGFERPLTDAEVGILLRAIGNGTPLPKGHGDLIDRRELIKSCVGRAFCNWYDEIVYAESIIEADKAEREEEE